MIKLAICDDNVNELAKTTEKINSYNIKEIDIDSYKSSGSLLASDAIYDIYILDVIMPDFNGIELAEKINKYNKNAVIIFLSTSKEFAVDSYSVNAFYYLLKPIEEEKFYSVLDKAIDKIKLSEECKMLLKDHGQIISVSKNDITYIEVQKDKLYYHFENDKVIETYGTMKDAIEVFLVCKNFVQPHRSFIVNLDFMTELYSDHLNISNEVSQIPVSKKQYHQVKEEYLNYMMDKVGG